jgi:hypothetical protein
MEKQKNDLEKQADIYLDVMPKMKVMQPEVINEDGPLENVAIKQNNTPDLDCGIYDSEQSSILPKLK